MYAIRLDIQVVKHQKVVTYIYVTCRKVLQVGRKLHR